MIRVVLEKDWQRVRWPMLMASVLALLYMLAIQSRDYPLDSRQHAAGFIAEWGWTGLFVVYSIAACVIFYRIWTAEAGDQTLSYLRALPLRRGRVWLGKLGLSFVCVWLLGMTVFLTSFWHFSALELGTGVNYGLATPPIEEPGPFYLRSAIFEYGGLRTVGEALLEGLAFVTPMSIVAYAIALLLWDRFLQLRSDAGPRWFLLKNEATFRVTWLLLAAGVLVALIYLNNARGYQYPPMALLIVVLTFPVVALSTSLHSFRFRYREPGLRSKYWRHLALGLLALSTGLSLPCYLFQGTANGNWRDLGELLEPIGHDRRVKSLPQHLDWAADQNRGNCNWHWHSAFDGIKVKDLPLVYEDLARRIGSDNSCMRATLLDALATQIPQDDQVLRHIVSSKGELLVEVGASRNCDCNRKYTAPPTRCSFGPDELAWIISQVARPDTAVQLARGWLQEENYQLRRLGAYLIVFYPGRPSEEATANRRMVLDSLSSACDLYFTGEYPHNALAYLEEHNAALALLTLSEPPKVEGILFEQDKFGRNKGRGKFDCEDNVQTLTGHWRLALDKMVQDNWDFETEFNQLAAIFGDGYELDFDDPKTPPGVYSIPYDFNGQWVNGLVSCMYDLQSSKSNRIKPYDVGNLQVYGDNRMIRMGEPLGECSLARIPNLVNAHRSRFFPEDH